MVWTGMGSGWVEWARVAGMELWWREGDVRWAGSSGRAALAGASASSPASSPGTPGVGAGGLEWWATSATVGFSTYSPESPSTPGPPQRTTLQPALPLRTPRPSPPSAYPGPVVCQPLSLAPFPSLSFVPTSQASKICFIVATLMCLKSLLSDLTSCGIGL